MTRLTRDVRREQVLQAAMRVVRRDGFQGVTRQTVADEAGCAPATVNNIFGTVDEMRKAIIDAAANELDPVVFWRGEGADV